MSLHYCIVLVHSDYTRREVAVTRSMTRAMDINLCDKCLLSVINCVLMCCLMTMLYITFVLTPPLGCISNTHGSTTRVHY